jgi:predicted ATPase/DNA-binding CsgD family transcriptional regulator
MGTADMAMRPGDRPENQEDRDGRSGVRSLRPPANASAAPVVRLPSFQAARNLADVSAPALDERLDNLPAPFSSLVGRERQIEELEQLMAAHRLVTLTGAPGVGKTRLAVQLAHQIRGNFADGIWMVELADLDEPTLVASVTAHALGVREADRTPLDALLLELRGRDLALVLDNCEHLLDACTVMVEALLRGCSGLRVLVTSRQALGLTGEIVWQVPSLSLPERVGPPREMTTDPQTRGSCRTEGDTLDALLASESGRLLVERARAARASFEATAADAPALAEICRRVDGIPLAIELAAARITHLAPQQIAERLDDRFRLLANGRSPQSPRHDTLRSLVDWSHELLSEPEQRVFRRLSVFAGGWALEAAERVCGEDALDLLAHLVDKSLVMVAELPATLRYSFHETIRHYAQEQLEASGEAPEVRRLHAEYSLALAEDAAPRLFGSELQPLLGILDREHDNLRIALRWSCETSASDVGPRLAGALWRFWQVRGYLREGRAWLEQLLATAMPIEPTSARARALNAIGFLTFLQGDYATARPLLAESVEIRRALDDGHGLVESLTNLGVLLRCLGDGARARQVLEEALAMSRVLGDRAWEGRALNKLARLTFYEGDLSAAQALHEQGISIVRQTGNAWDMAIALGDLADVCHALGDAASARGHYAESLRLWLELGDERGVAQGLEGFAILAFADSRPGHAVRLVGAARAIRDRLTEPNSPTRRAALDRLLEAARADLGAAYDAAWETGYTASPVEAVAEAMADHDAIPADHPAPAIASGSAPSVAPDPGRLSTTPAVLAVLTERERDVAALLARGYSNRQITDALVISERTTEWHISNLLRKTGLTGRAQMIVWAIEHFPESASRE